MKNCIKKLLSIVVVVALCVGLLGHLPVIFESTEVNAAVTTSKQVNVGFDLTNEENRADGQHATFINWGIPELAVGESVSYEYEDGVTFTLINDCASGRIYGNVEKNLFTTEGESPVLTADGVRCSAFRNGVIKLEITGLPAGTHTLTSWHSFYYLDNSTMPRGTMTVTANDVDIATGVEVPVKAPIDNQAAIVHGEFEAKEGEPVVIYFKSDGNGSTNNVPVLNGFEIDGVHPLKAINNASPADKDYHFEIENGLSWVAAGGAKSHRVFIGDDEFTVATASRDFPEFKGEISETSFDLTSLDMEFDHMKSYYWRVDEVFDDGTVVTGKVYEFRPAHLAFPTAEGYGRYALGGRGGQVIEVTTLEDGYVPVLDADGNPIINTVVDGAGNPVLDEEGNPTTEAVVEPIEGSLRWAIESHTGPRIIVFRVGGVIKLKQELVIDGEHGNVYVAGQTAPGDGITLTTYNFGTSGASDVIIRNIRVRIGDDHGSSMGGMGMAGGNDSIIDHCSISWATDEGFSSRNGNNITFQRNIIAETLNNSVHYLASDSGSSEDRVEGATERHSFAASISGDIGSFHHNLLIHNTGRNWSLAGGTESDGVTYGGRVDIRYNVVYNWQNRTTDGGARRVQFVGNYYKMGPASRDMDIFSIDGNEVNLPDIQIAYLDANKMVDTEGNILLDPVLDDDWKKASVLNKNNNLEDINDSISHEPFFESYIAPSTADEAYESVIKDVGAIAPTWDYLDARYIKEVTEGTYTHTGSKDGLPGIIDKEEDAGGYPNDSNFKGAEAPADTDHDGMPDEWETLHGLNPEDASDNRVVTLSAEGYTNLEMYLCELMNDPLQWKNEDQRPDPTATPTPTPEPTEMPVDYTLGDINADEKINATDALMALQHAARIATLDETQSLAADVTKDGNVDATDALKILQLAAGIIDSFE